MEKEIVVPGMRLCALEEDRYSAGRGTYAMHGYIYASIAGNLRLVSKADIIFLKHDSSTLRLSSNHVCSFSMMEQVRLCAHEGLALHF